MKTDTLLVGKNVNGNVQGGNFRLKFGAVESRVKIYHRVEKQRYGACFTLAYYENGLRHLKPFSSLEAAKDEAQEVLRMRLVLGEADLGDCASGQRANP